jgi:hypothetical protein
MPSTYSPQDAINLVQTYAHGAPLVVPAANIVDMISSAIWRYYPWGWSINSFTQTNMVQLTQGAGAPPTGGAQFTGNRQDYTITGAWFTYPINIQFGGVTNNNFGGGFIVQTTPNGLSEVGTTVTINTLYPHNLPTGATLAGTTGTIVCDANTAWNGLTVTITTVSTNQQIVGTVSPSGLPASGGSGAPLILRPLKMRLARLDTNPPEYRELAALANLSPELSRTAGIDTMGAVGWFASQSFFRLMNSPQVSQGQIIQLLGEYQARPAKVTAANMTTPFPFPDDYFNVMDAGVLWKVYQLTDDPRAGGAQQSKNGSMIQQYTGQLGHFMSLLLEMARTEDLNAGDEFMYPESPLGVGRSYWPGLLWCLESVGYKCVYTFTPCLVFQLKDCGALQRPEFRSCNCKPPANVKNLRGKPSREAA